jgi:hypothetical protein
MSCPSSPTVCLPDQFGSATITLFISDGELVSISSFLLTVLPVNDPPVLDALADFFPARAVALWTMGISNAIWGA